MRAKGPRTSTNEQAFFDYRQTVEMDLRSPSPIVDTGQEWSRNAQIAAHWFGRYSRRRDRIQGISGYGQPLADTIAVEALLARNRAKDAQVQALPAWDEMTQMMVEMSLQNLKKTGRIDVSTLAEPCPCGPSLRRLWAEAKARGLADAQAWDSISAWAHSRPPAWQRDDERKRRRQPPLDPAVAERQERAVFWQATGDLDIPWQAEVDGQIWQVRLNDFPDEWMYTLLIEGQVAGDLHDWPQAWNRTGEPASVAPPVAAAPIAQTPLPAAEAAAKWLARYQAGEFEAVWAEMVALGPKVREAQYLGPARAVARETMRRARHNVELIIKRLDAMGYDFWDRERRNARGIWSWRPRKRVSDHLKHEDTFLPPGKDEGKKLDALEREGMVFPLSLRAWMEEVGSVDLTGTHPTLSFFESDPGFAGVYADPLMVLPTADLIEDLQGLGDEDSDLLIAHDAECKAILDQNAQLDGGYYLEVPNPAADGLLIDERHELHFVAYLRLSFRWGGFPGWEGQPNAPTREIAMLTDGLLPL
jgi:hypothetical protein